MTLRANQDKIVPETASFVLPLTQPSQKPPADVSGVPVIISGHVPGPNPPMPVG
jgi:hypothetical protein